MFDWVDSLAPDNDLARILVVLLILLTIVILRFGLPSIRHAMRKGETPQEVDLFERVKTLTDDALVSAREDIKALRDDLKATQNRVSSLERTLSRTRERLERAIRFISEQQNYIAKHLSERDDHPVWKDDSAPLDEED